MCGIIGFLGKKLPSQELFEQARDTMFHRGPDDAGVYYSPKEGVVLGHRRLSILDLSMAGHQPMVSNDGRYTITFNGEIYNYLEIKKELKDFYNFKTATDTEVLLAAYAKWGVNCLERLRGMFAFAIWDKQQKNIFIARDRLGIKPLYYQADNLQFCFASEIKAIITISGINKKLDRSSLSDYLSYRYPLGDKTMFLGIKSLLPGYFLKVSTKGLEGPKQYWDLAKSANNKSQVEESDALFQVENLLKKTIKSHLISDVPLGAYLSGGLDSSLLVAMMSEILKKPVKTFSMGFAEEGFNESNYAKIVADKFKTEHHEIILSSGKYFEFLPEVINFKSAPLSVPNEVALYALSKELKKEISVVLSGEGADELFCGYGKIFRSGYDWGRIKAGKLNADLMNNLLNKYKRLNFKDGIEFFLEQYSYWPVKEKINLLSSNILSKQNSNYLLNQDFFRSIINQVSDLPVQEQYAFIFQKIHLLGLLHRLDTTTMSSGVEARVPFVDHKLIEKVISLPINFKMHYNSKKAESLSSLLNSNQISEVHDTTKYLLKKIARKYLPKEIVERKKIGFPVPLDKWFDGDLMNKAKELILSKDSRMRVLYNSQYLNNLFSLNSSKHGQQIWMLLNLEIWVRQFDISI